MSFPLPQATRSQETLRALHSVVQRMKPGRLEEMSFSSGSGTSRSATERDVPACAGRTDSCPIWRICRFSLTFNEARRPMTTKSPKSAGFRRYVLARTDCDGRLYSEGLHI